MTAGRRPGAPGPSRGCDALSDRRFRDLLRRCLRDRLADPPVAPLLADLSCRRELVLLRLLGALVRPSAHRFDRCQLGNGPRPGPDEGRRRTANNRRPRPVDLRYLAEPGFAWLLQVLRLLLHGSERAPRLVLHGAPHTAARNHATRRNLV